MLLGRVFYQNNINQIGTEPEFAFPVSTWKAGIIVHLGDPSMEVKRQIDSSACQPASLNKMTIYKFSEKLISKHKGERVEKGGEDS